MSGAVRACIGSSIALVAGLAPGSANAGNTVHPRTPVQWPAVDCIQTVDRSVDPRLAFSYAILNEDSNVTADELEDSRRHQFVAFCRHWERETGLPNYLSDADLQRVIAAGLDTADARDGDVLDDDLSWPTSCWARITADDARRPISFAAASDPVVWDTTGVEAGVYRIAGYTWEPPLNLWSAAPWAVRVVDGLDDDVGPAVVLGPLPAGVAHDESLPLELCVHAPEGSRLELSWALKEPDPRFEQVASTDYDGTAAQLAFVPPEPSWGESILLAVTIEDPRGARYTAHGPRELIVYAEPQPAPAEGSTSAGDETGTEAETEPNGPSGSEPQAGAPRAAGCTAGRRGRGSGLGALGALALVGLVRRRAKRTTHEEPSRGRR